MAATDGDAEHGSTASGHDPKSSADLGHVPVSLREIALGFAKVGTVGFGGGLGMLALLRNEVVERRRWLDDEHFCVGVALGQMLPGPFVSNYAEYIGYELRGGRGMVTAHVSLMLPCFVLMLVLSVLYFRFGSLGLVTRLFSGIQPVVVGILAWATWSIGRANIRNWRSLAIGVIAAAALFLKVDALLVVVGCGILGMVLNGKGPRDRGIKGPSEDETEVKSQKPKAKSQNGRGRRANGERRMAFVPWLPVLLFAAVAAGPSVWEKAGELAYVFLKIGAAAFGGGFAAIPFLQREVVDIRHWLTMKEFIDGVALGQVTPGPVAITGAFIGYKVLGIPGAVIAYLGTFLPSFLMLLGLIRVYRRVQYNRAVQGFLSGVMPAVTGMILTATVFVGKSAITGPAPAVVAPLVLCLLLRFNVEPVWLILGGALVGLAF